MLLAGSQLPTWYGEPDGHVMPARQHLEKNSETGVSRPRRRERAIYVIVRRRRRGKLPHLRRGVHACQTLAERQQPFSAPLRCRPPNVRARTMCLGSCCSWVATPLQHDHNYYASGSRDKGSKGQLVDAMSDSFYTQILVTHLCELAFKGDGLGHEVLPQGALRLGRQLRHRVAPQDLLHHLPDSPRVLGLQRQGRQVCRFASS